MLKSLRRQRSILFGTGLALAAVVTGCTNKSDSPARPPNKLAALEIQVQPGLASPQQENLLKAMQAPGDATQPLVAAFIETHRAAYEQTIQGRFSTPTAFEDQLKALAPQANDHASLKQEFESWLERNGSQLRYNATHPSLFSIVNQERMQCYSGTSLFEVVRQLNPTIKNAARMSVVIFESGHVLPGYVEATPQGNVLVGIETTVAGKGIKSYGLVSNLSGVRIVDADYFMAIESLETIISNPQQVVKKALELTAAKIGLDLVKTEQSIAGFTPLFTIQNTTTLSAQDLQALSRDLLQRVNMSILQFGQSVQSPYDQTRQKMDVVPANTSGVPGPRVVGFPIPEAPPFDLNSVSHLKLLNFLFQSRQCLPRSITKFYRGEFGYLPTTFGPTALFELRVEGDARDYNQVFQAEEARGKILVTERTYDGKYPYSFIALNVNLSISDQRKPVILTLWLPRRDAWTLAKRGQFSSERCRGSIQLSRGHLHPAAGLE